MLKYDKLPYHMQDAAKGYLEDGIPPGSFLQAVLENNLVGAFGCADEVNTMYMREWANWLYNECPIQAWKTQERINDWIQAGGLRGQGLLGDGAVGNEAKGTLLSDE